MYKELEKINLNFNEQKVILFNKYIELFSSFNTKVNLVSKNDINFLFEKHIYDSLALNLFFQKYITEKSIEILDIGTGGGFPSLPLALNYENYKITAVDSVNKKINFIRLAAEDLHLKNINPICSRVEDLPENRKNYYNVVTTRAMAELREILEYALPFVKKGGYFVAYKSIKAEEELKNASNALKILSAIHIDTIEYKLPIESENKRVLLIFRKINNIPSSYPRRNGLVKKKPL